MGGERGRACVVEEVEEAEGRTRTSKYERPENKKSSIGKLQRVTALIAFSV